jgi:hypothetical protein
MDLAVANNNSDNVSVLLNNGNGTFATKVDYGAGDTPRSVFSSDLDGDGDMDLVVANYNSDNVSVLLNNGDGTFAAKVDYGAGDHSCSVFSSDLDGDGDMDLAVANFGSDDISVFLNNGDGTFASKLDYVAGNDPVSVFSSDLDGDGDMDLAVTNNSDNVSVLLNNNALVTVTSPNGGEEWEVDNTYNITWTSTGTSGDIKIEYSTDNGSAWTEIIASMPDTGAYSWLIPDTISDSCLVRISDTDGNPSDTSDAVFAITVITGVPDLKLPKVYSMSVKPASIGNKLEVRYALPVKASVKFSLYDIRGANVKEITEEKLAGYHLMEIDMRGRPKGVYFLKIEANGFAKTSKAVLM